MKFKEEPHAISRLMYIIEADLEYLISLLITGAFLATLTSELGMSDGLTGIISSFVSLGCLFQVLSIFFHKANVKRFVMLLNASLDTTNPFEIMVKGNMTNAVLLNKDGSERKLESHREGDCLCVNIPTIDIWDITFVLID